MVHPYEAQHDELPQDGAPLHYVEVSANAESGESLMAELLDLLRALAPQDIDDLLRAERKPARLLAAQYTGHQFPCRLGTIPLLRRRQAVVAVATGLTRLSEVIEQPHPATVRGLA